jgi:hypothetical protein
MEKEQPIDNSGSPLIGTWEGEDEEVYAKWTFEKNGTVAWEQKLKNPLPGLPLMFVDGKYSGRFVDHGTYFYAKHSDEWGSLDGNWDYQIDEGGFLILRNSYTSQPTKHKKIN